MKMQFWVFTSIGIQPPQHYNGFLGKMKAVKSFQPLKPYSGGQSE